MGKPYILLFLIIQITGAANTDIVFKENKNQWPKNVLFGADYKTTKFFVNKAGFNFCVYDGNDLYKGHEAKHSEKINEDGTVIKSKQLVKSHNYAIVFNNASFLNSDKLSPLTEYYNYFIGNDETKWVGNVKAYEALLFSNIYPNIDLKLYSNKGDIKYDFIVKAHGDVGQINLDYKNVDGLTIKNGNLIVETSVGTIVEQKPYAYQIIKGKKIEVACQYILKNNSVAYDFPNSYNADYELIIDPTIVVCSYDNSPNWSNCYGSNFDRFGNIFVLGVADSGYPTTPGAFQTVMDSMFDIIVTKYNSIGSSKFFSTYLGGNNVEYPQNIVITNSDITAFGVTRSNNFPVTSNAFDTSYNDTLRNYDFFISKLNLTGSSLIASTYIGGSDPDGINVMAAGGEVNHMGNMVIDSIGNVYVCSSTNSADFPTTVNAFQTTKDLNVDNVAFKLDSTLQTMIFSTFFGGSSTENAFYSKLVNGNELLICGTTLSPDFPTTAGTLSQIKNSFRDMYVFHLNGSGTSLIASTFLGTPTNEYAHFIDTDLNNDIYVCGYMVSTTAFVPTPGLYTTATGRSTIYKLNSTLSSIIYKTKFGPGSFLEYNAFKIDSCQNIYMSGFTTNNNWPVTADKFQNYNLGSDLYITVFNTNMLSLKFASYFGGRNDEHADGGTSYFSDKGILYQGICINNGNLPTTSGAFQTTFPTLDTLVYNDAFVKIDLQSFIKTTSSYGPEIKGCTPFIATFNSFANTGTVSWNFGDGTPISNQQNTTHTYTAFGDYNVYLVATDTNTCNKTDTVKSIIKIINPTNLSITGNPKLCDDASTILTAETNEPVTYKWNTGATTNTVSIQSEGIYEVTTNNGGCDSKQMIEVKHYDTNLDAVFPNVITPNNDKVNDEIDLSKYRFTQVTFTVFDRWGTEKFKTEKSDAIFNGNNCMDGTYFYTLNYTNECTSSEIKTKGFITVFK